MKMYSIAAVAAVTLLLGVGGALAAGGTGHRSTQPTNPVSSADGTSAMSFPWDSNGAMPSPGANQSSGVGRCDHILAAPRTYSKAQVDFCLGQEHG